MHVGCARQSVLLSVLNKTWVFALTAASPGMARLASARAALAPGPQSRPCRLACMSEVKKRQAGYRPRAIMPVGCLR